MFSLFSKRQSGDAFDQRQRLMEVWKTVRRIVDRTSEHRSFVDDDSRTQSRNVRCLPVLVVPWNDNQPDADSALFAITHDFSDQGVSLLVQEPQRDTILCGFWDASPIFLRGKVRRCAAFGGGYFQIGVEFDEHVPTGDVHSVVHLAEQLDARVASV